MLAGGVLGRQPLLWAALAVFVTLSLVLLLYIYTCQVGLACQEKRNRKVYTVRRHSGSPFAKRGGSGTGHRDALLAFVSLWNFILSFSFF